MIKKTTILFILIYIFIIPFTYATDEIISSQMETLNISAFIKEGEKYTKEVFPDISLSDFLTSAIKGEIDNKGLFKQIILLFGDEILEAVYLLGSIIVIILIHSIFKAFTESLENESVSQITYYIQYILIVTLIMTNFSSIISLIKDSIANLTGFVNCLIPILLALMSATRKYCICYINTATNYICSSFYRKYYNISYTSYNTYCNIVGNYFEPIR